MTKKRKIIAWLIIGGILLVWVAMFFFIGKPLIQMIQQPESFRTWIQSFGFGGKLLFIAMVALQVVVAIIPGEPIELVAGYAFGAWEGTLLCMLGFLIGSDIIFLLVKRFRKPLLSLFFSEKQIESLWFLHSSSKRNLLLFLLMFLPGTPKDLISYVVGLTDIRLRVWLPIVAITRIPSLITSTIGGDAMGLQNYQFAIVVFAITLILTLFGYATYTLICKRQH